MAQKTTRWHDGVLFGTIAMMLSGFAVGLVLVTVFPQQPVFVDQIALDRPLIAVGHLAGKGRGVVAISNIPINGTIERCPVLIIPEKDRAAVDKTIVFTYFFMWEHGTTEQDLYGGRGRAAIALGLSSLLNHAYEPNACFIRHIDALELELRALRPIRAGEEITIDYQMDLWFDPA